MTEAEKELEITAEWKIEGQDEDGFMSIWALAQASSTPESDAAARLLASRLLGFLCKKRYPHIIIAQHDVDYLEDWLERDAKVMNDWKPTSEHLLLVTQAAHVPAKAAVDFLTSNKFNATKNYTSTRAVRREWFFNDWNVG